MVMDATPTGRVMNVRTGLTYPTINDAIGDGNTLDGDTLLAGSGDYPEAVVVSKAVTLIGLDNGSGMPVVNPGGSGAYAISIESDNTNVYRFNAIGPACGIYVRADYANVIGNDLTGNTNAGIFIDPVSNCNLLENTANNGVRGIYSLDQFSTNSVNNKIIGNTVNYNSIDGIYMIGTDNVIAANTASHDKEGIAITSSMGTEVAGNIVDHSIDTINSMGSGIGIAISNGNDIGGNMVTDNNNGIVLVGSDDNAIDGNVVMDNDVGIDLDNSNSNNVSYNMASFNKWGFFLISSTNNNLSRNFISSNAKDGLYLYDCSNCNVSRNYLLYNKNGTFLQDSANNALWLNVIAVNMVNASVIGQGTNHWNSTAPMSYTYNGAAFTNYTGNYWGDYTGPDTNGDGIGDTIYPINTDNPDYYPMLGGSAAVGPLPFQVVLKPGWNVVSEPLLLDSANSSVDTFFAPAMGKITIIWGYDASTGQWHSYVPGAGGNDLLSIGPGEGYLVMMNTDADYTVG